MQPAYKVVQIQGMSAYGVRSPGPDSCVCIVIGESRLYGFLYIGATSNRSIQAGCTVYRMVFLFLLNEFFGKVDVTS